MAITHSGIMTDSVATAYDKEYLFNFMMSRVWFDLVDWQTPIGGNLRGSTINTPIMEDIAAATTALNEEVDPTPVALVDNSISMTIAEYGNAVQLTRYLKIVAFTEIERAAAKVVGQNQAKSIDQIIRNVACAGTLVEYPGVVTARADLDATSDKITYDFVTRLMATAASMGMPPFEDGSYVTVIHPALFRDLQNLAEWKSVGEYSDPKLIYTGRPGQIYGGYKFKGEVGSIGGLRFIMSRYGRLLHGAGTAAQAASTVTEPIAAGDTTMTVVTPGTGLAVGDWITIDAGLATEEQVQVVSIDTLVYTIKGMGNAFGNFGFKYAHLDNAAIVEGANVAVLPVMGPTSIRGRFASEVGKNGEVRISEAATVIPGRFINHSWYWVGGFARMEKYLVRGEVAVTGGVFGDNF